MADKNGKCNNNSTESSQVVDYHGADGGGRTHTSSRIPDFESGASANSATSATMESNGFNSITAEPAAEKSKFIKIGP